MLHMLQRHRDILYDFSKEFKKTAANVAAARDHAELLGSIRDEINNNHRPGSAEEMLMGERGKIDSSHKLADIVLEQALETREAIVQQGRMLFHTRGRVLATISKFPLINNLLSRIKTKKQKDALVLGGVISVCICILLWFTLIA
ncbi:Golgi SNAP receptor complex member 1 [Phlyctochytrium bullatum]|nr:Golgi SNAP receptor complex member 1 [Phlyctochytrium bullatum]